MIVKAVLCNVSSIFITLYQTTIFTAWLSRNRVSVSLYLLKYELQQPWYGCVRFPILKLHHGNIFFRTLRLSAWGQAFTKLDSLILSVIRKIQRSTSLNIFFYKSWKFVSLWLRSSEILINLWYSDRPHVFWYRVWVLRGATNEINVSEIA